MPDVPGVDAVTTHICSGSSEFRAPDGVGPTSLIARGDRDPRATLFDVLNRQVQGYWKRKPNFEDLVHLLEQLDWLYPLPPRDGTLDSYRPLLGAFVKPDARWNIQHAFGHAADHVCKEILQYVSNHCDRVEEQGAHVLAGFLQRLSRLARLWVYSLNYDDVPEHADLDFFTGYGSSPNAFDPSWTLPPQGRHSHLQMHGSVLNGIGKQGTWTAPRYPSRREALQDRARVTKGPMPFQDGYRASQTGMITGMRKSDHLMLEPYATYMASFRAALYATNRWLIVGYGGGDTHINQLLMTAIAHHRNPPRVAIINHDDSPFPNDEFWRKARRALPWTQDLSPLMALPRERFVPLGRGLAVSFEGTCWAFGSGFPALCERLGL